MTAPIRWPVVLAERETEIFGDECTLSTAPPRPLRAWLSDALTLLLGAVAVVAILLDLAIVMGNF